MVEATKRLIPYSLPVVKKSIFKLYLKLNESRFKSLSAQKYIKIVSMIFKGSQLISIVILSSTFVTNYSTTGFLCIFLEIFRIDILAVRLGYQSYFTVLFISLVFINLFFKVIIFLQILYKKYVLVYIPIYIANVTSWVLKNILQIPFTVYGLVCLSSLLNLGYSNDEYSGSFYTPSLALNILVCVCLSFFIVIEISDCIFRNTPKYSSASVTRAHSFLNIKEFELIIVLLVLKQILAQEYFLYAYGVSSIWMIGNYYYYLPYFSLICNFFYVQMWFGVLLSSFLFVVCKNFKDFVLLEVNLIVLFIAFSIINYQMILKRIKYIKMLNKSSNPYIHDLRIRYYLFDSVGKSNEEIKEHIYLHFFEANKNFFEFKPQYIWESLIVKKYLKNPQLGILKLIKISICQYKINETLSNPNKKIKFIDFLTLETEFLLYFFFEKNIKKLQLNNYDLYLIKYFTYYSEYKELDHEISHVLAEFTVSLTLDTNSKAVHRNILKIGKLLKNAQEVAEKTLEKFGLETKFCKLYGTLLKDILNVPKGKELLTKSGTHGFTGGSMTKDFSEVDGSQPLLIISGWYQNIGTIVYANPAIYTLLKIKKESSLIGVSFTTLIPRPFDDIHNNVLFRFLFHRNSTSLQRSHLFLMDINNECIEVIMDFHLVFYKYNPYFIANFKPMIPIKNLILWSIDGTIYSESENIKNFFPEKEYFIYSKIPKLGFYLEKYQDEQAFKYSENLECYMKKSTLTIDGYQLNILYIQEIHDQDRGAHNLEPIEFHYDNPIEVKKFDIVKNKDFKFSEAESKSDLLDVKINKTKADNAITATKVLNYSVRLCACLQIFFILAMLVITLEVLSSLSLNQIISDTGLLRYHSTSILSNVRSLDLLSKNYTLAYTQDRYRSLLLSNSAGLRTIIEKYRSISMPLTNNNRYYFNERIIKLYFFLNNTQSTQDVTLYDAIKMLISYSSLIAETNLSTISSLNQEILFLYRNIPCDYIDNLNQTVVAITNDIISSIGNLYRILEIIELICLFPPLVNVLISLMCFLYIEIINKALWKKISSIKYEKLLASRSKLIARLSIVHEFDFKPDFTNNKVQPNLYSPIIWSPLVKITVLLLISSGFYLGIVYGIQNTLQGLLETELNHTCYGGMRRMLSPLTLFWAREAMFEYNNLESYINIVPFYQISNSNDELVTKSDLFINIQKGLMNSLYSNVQSKYSYSSYIKLMLGDACTMITNIPNCSQGITNYGVDPGIKLYLNELQTSVDLSKTQGFSGKNMIKIEKYSKNIELSQILGISVYGNYTDQLISDLKSTVAYIIVLFFIIICAYYFAFLHKVTENIIASLNDMIKILTIFEIPNDFNSGKRTKISLRAGTGSLHTT